MKKIFLMVIFIFFILNFSEVFYADEDYSIAYINDFSGECEVKRKGEDIAEVIQNIYIPLYEGDEVMTEDDSFAEIIFDDATVIKLDSNSRLKIQDLKRGKENKTLLDLIKGKILAVVKKLKEKEEFAVKTKMAMAAVKGTEFIVYADEDEKIGVYKGKVEVKSFDREGNVRQKILIKDNDEIVVIKRLRKIKRMKLSKNFIKRYKEIKDLRKKIEYIRSLRRSGKIKKYKLKRKLERIQKLKHFYKNNKYQYKKLTPEQKKLINEIIKREKFYKAQLKELEKKEKRKKRIKFYLKNKNQ